jgi:hypothetical protein
MYYCTRRPCFIVRYDYLRIDPNLAWLIFVREALIPFVRKVVIPAALFALFLWGETTGHLDAMLKILLN